MNRLGETLNSSDQTDKEKRFALPYLKRPIDNRCTLEFPQLINSLIVTMPCTGDSQTIECKPGVGGLRYTLDARKRCLHNASGLAVNELTTTLRQSVDHATYIMNLPNSNHR